MKSRASVLVTGGSGLLGSELQRLLPGAKFPSSDDFDVTDLDQMVEYFGTEGYAVLIHAAALTSPPRIDDDPLGAVEVNIIGTANVVRLCASFDTRLLYVSTDYVFRGDRGGYREEDDLHPVNRYAWSKLGGECAVRLYDRSLIVRTSFGPDVFPYEKAFCDQWTSRESVSVVAKKIVDLVDAGATGVVHVGGRRRTVYEYATSLDPTREVGELSVAEVGFDLPSDTSLDCERFESIVRSEGGR